MLILLCFLFSLGIPTLKSQVIDEDNGRISEYIGVGQDSLDFIAQSFFANVDVIRKLGVWLREVIPGGEVRISLAPTDSVGLPDVNNLIYSSVLIDPGPLGGDVVDSTMQIPVVQGDKYWVVVNGFNNSGSSGYSSTGVSNVPTDTGENLFFSSNGGVTWGNLISNPMTIFVEGGFCLYPAQTVPGDTTLCLGDTLTVRLDNTAYTSYSWSTGASSDSIIITSPGFYAVTVADTSGCPSTSNLLVSPAALPDPGLDSLTFTCFGSAFIITAASGFASYDWSTGDVSSFTFVSDTIQVWVTVTDSLGCSASDTTLARYFPLLPVDIGGDTSFCDGEFIQLDAGSGFAGYAWSTGATTRSIVIQNTDTITVLVTDTNGCSSSSGTVIITEYPRPDTPSVTLIENILRSSPGLFFQWYKDGIPIPGADGQNYTPDSSGTYSVEVSNQFGCSRISEGLEVVFEINNENFIPDGFSPNGDGVNDVFFIQNIDLFPDNELIIFNRWGQELYRIQGYQNDWDGNFNGRKLPDGDYFYILTLEPGEEPVKGNLLISR